MSNQSISQSHRSTIKWLTYLMFMMFAMTTDAVGVIIPEVMKAFNLNMTTTGMIHYMPMIAMALSGVFLDSYLTNWDVRPIVLGLTVFAINSYLYIVANTMALS